MKAISPTKFLRLSPSRYVTKSVSLALLLLAGCSDNKTSEPQTQASSRSSGSSGPKLVIKGSNTIGEELGPRLIAEFKKDHPNAAIEFETKGTGSGFWGLIAGVCDIAAASRPANNEEIEQAKSRNIEFNEHVIGSYSVAVIANAGNAVSDLSPEQVRDVFTGAVQNWKDVGGSDAPIHVCVRDPISGTHLGFRELAMENKPYAAGTNAFNSYAGIVEAVAKDQNAVGYASVDLASKAGVKPLSIKGVAPSAVSVNEHKYPYARALRLYTNKSKEASTAAEFISFVESKRGQEIVAQMGNVPRP
jgi:phosphate transport system substrate-binding protein